MKGPQLSVFNYKFQNKADDGSADIYIDGSIVDASTQEFYKYFGDDTSTSYKSFRDLVNQSDAKIFNVYINSGGGQVVEAMAIHDLLIDMQSKGKTVNTVARGICASSATYILMAGKNPAMSSNSWLMIHNVSGFTYGTVDEIENYAVTMRKFNDASNKFYCDATGLSKTVVGNMMNAETWLTASDAKEKGFIKEVAGEATFSNSIKPEQWPFQNTAVLNAYNSFTQKNIPVMDTTKITEAITNGFNSLLQKLGISDKKDDKVVTDAFTEFSTSITNSIAEGIKEIKVPDNEAITKLVNDAITNSFKTIPENFTAAITEATKNSLKKEDLTEALKNTLSTADFKTQMDAFTNSVIAKIGGATDPETGNEDKDKDKLKNKSRKAANNRFHAAFEAYNN